MQSGMNDHDGDESMQKGLAKLQFRRKKAADIKPPKKKMPPAAMPMKPGMKY